MEAVILAGGIGSRLRELVTDVPKPMAPIVGKPFLEILLNSLAQKGFRRVILSLGYMADKVISHFGSRFSNIDLSYVVEDKPLGTGGALRLATDEVESDHFFVFNGDTFLDLEADQVELKWQRDRRPLIVGCNVPETSRYGRLLTTGSSVTGFTEKGVYGKGLINAGSYLLNSGQLKDFSVGTPFSLEHDYLPAAVSRGEFDIFVSKGKFIDIGIPEDFLRAQQELSEFLY